MTSPASDPEWRKERYTPKGAVSIFLTAFPSPKPLKKLPCRSTGRRPPLLMPWPLRVQDRGGCGEGAPSSPTVKAQSKPPSRLLLQAEFAHCHLSPAPDTQYWVNRPGLGPCGNSGELWLSFPGMHRHQQKFISQTLGYFENQISSLCSSQIGTFQVLLCNRNLFCLQLPLTHKNSRERERPLEFLLPISARAQHTFLANFPGSAS